MKKYLFALFSIALAFFTYNQINQQSLTAASNSEDSTTMSDKYALATFAGGCFWCIEAPYEYQDGVISAVSGYAGGKASTANYRDVSSGRTQHLEVVQVQYDPSVVSYATLLDIFWRQIDPTDAGGSFVDRGKQYSSAIFYHDDSQKTQAEASKQALAESGIFNASIATDVRALDTFYPAEDYHQDYYKENSIRYKLYRQGSGRDQFIKKNWKGKEAIDLTPTVVSTVTDKSEKQMTNTVKNSSQAVNPKTEKAWLNFVKPSDKELKATLSSIEYKVTQKDGTERAFTGPFVDNKEDGIYVDIVSGEPLFSSTHKYKSGTGWPSFYDIIEKDTIVTKEDRKLWSVRTELRSKYGDSHLGHVFSDGPQPTGQRYCINGAALKFVAKNDMQQLGYGEYLYLFK